MTTITQKLTVGPHHIKLTAVHAGEISALTITDGVEKPIALLQEGLIATGDFEVTENTTKIIIDFPVSE